MEDFVIRKGDQRWDRLYELWKSDKKEPGWLVKGTEQYRVIAGDDEDILFVLVAGNIDGMYGSMTQGVPE